MRYIKSAQKALWILGLWVGLLGNWSDGDVWAQSTELEEATQLNAQVMQLYQQGKYREALTFAHRALKLRESTLGPEHPDLATSLNNLALIYASMGDYSAAEPLYIRSIAIDEKVFGSESLPVANGLNNLALLYDDMGNYFAAEPLYKRSISIWEKMLGFEHQGLASSLYNLAALYHTIGNYSAAEPLYKRSIAIWEKALNPESSQVAHALDGLAVLYDRMGNYAAAEQLYSRSLMIKKKILSPDHPDVAVSLSNLSGYFLEIGRHYEALRHIQRALLIAEKTLGKLHPTVARYEYLLAAIYHAMGNYAAAEHSYKLSLWIREKTLGPEHIDVATSLNGLAVFYRDIGNYSEAIQLSQRALRILEKALGPEHPAVAASLNTRALIYQDFRNHAAAEPLYTRSLAINEKKLGPKHPTVAISLGHLAALKAALGNNRTSLELLMRAQDIEEDTIDQVAGFTSTKKAMQYMVTQKRGIELYLSLVNTRMKYDSAACNAAMEIWLRRKGGVFEVQRRMQQALFEDGDQEAIQAFEELSRARNRLAELILSGPGNEESINYLMRIEKVVREKEELETKAITLSQPYAQARKIRKVTVGEVARALPQGTVLVDIARINVFNFEAKVTEKKWLPAHYLAFVLRPGQGQDVALLDLGFADEIDTALSQFKSALTQKQEINARDLGRKIHDQVFAPLQKELGEAQRIFLSPDGALNLLPFEVLLDPEGKYLIEKYTFNYLAAGRDLVGFSEKKASAEKPVLLGDPDFDLDPNKKSQALDRLGMRLDTAVASVRSAEERNFRFDRLPNTRREVSAIGDLLGKGQCEVFLDSSALEEVLQTRKSPRILHLATHGFFLEDQKFPETRGIGGTVSFSGMNQGYALPLGPQVNLENPLLRSGIALAGANRAGSFGQGGDGILTADEVLGLKLQGTDLVVLSACETGLGEVKTGEGVFGLRRAFAQAGARSLVMSMWSVPDEPTKDLMVEFYKNILSGKFDRCQSLRQAALKMKQKYGDNPYYWGAFVFLGQAD